ncbi:NgoMIV family type II restriction endonuclease [Streptomyces cylindrosporus]|uniref:NgoMIV family type II restriction endonuclease n=1 Tax=Streptomyces cylindrosporus TaxID=2927583 RepID=A0ABS9YHQ5_9ACTN|nr:NgoMIV family type II restriction endonuclease [Streptomyces cylindrosporus]MCI3276479.1 NgoMIV family type II restriction endonuclease [Streptomyces cylindrosporus]
MTAELSEARNRFHQNLVSGHTLSLSPGGVASNADSSQKTSLGIALSIANDLSAEVIPEKLKGQRAGKQFEEAVEGFLRETFPLFQRLRPGAWTIENVGGSRAEYQISKYEPYTHLADLASAVENDRTLASVLGNSYEISPDILVLRNPELDDVINGDRCLVDANSGRYAVIRMANQERPIVHAIVSCKWTLRSDRAQNARSEALNIIRNRKGRTPHIAVVTGEPSPSRLASLALGTGDIDTVYHFALPELIKAVDGTQNDEAIGMLHTLLDGKRLRDISDLPLDLAI